MEQRFNAINGMHYKEQPKPIKSLPPIEPMDLRSVSRDRDMVSTTISVDIDYQLDPAG